MFRAVNLVDRFAAYFLDAWIPELGRARLRHSGRPARLRHCAQTQGRRRGYTTATRALLLAAAGAVFVEVILDGRQTGVMNPPALTEPFPICWAQQRASI
ncbi:MAG: hypothetical protein ACOVN5_09720 [Aquidulcibacter sp.]